MFSFKPLTIKDVKTIKNWSFTKPGSKVYMDPYIKSHENGDDPLLGPDKCAGFGVWKDSSLFGLFEYYKKGEDLEIGFVINPKFRGKGFGSKFLQSGIDFGLQNVCTQAKKVVATVEKDNIAAIKTLEKIGFRAHSESEDEIILTTRIAFRILPKNS